MLHYKALQHSNIILYFSTLFIYLLLRKEKIITWNEQDHPRDNDGKFTFKNGGNNTGTVTGGAASVLYRDSNIKAEIEKQESEYKNKLLDILGNKATPADVLYAKPTKLEKKIKELGLGNKLKGIMIDGASGIPGLGLEKVPIGGAANINNQTKQNFTRPVEGKVISEFGPRNISLKNASKDHKGIDIYVPVGTPVKVMADGTVIAARNGMRGYGIGVFVDHGVINGKHVISEYGHLSKFNVRVGDKVKQGQIIAKSGNTGTSEGPHLHVTIKENNIHVNPRKYLDYRNK